MKQPRDRSANRPGATMKVFVNGRTVTRARHDHKPAGSKLAKLAREGRCTTR